MILTIDTKNTVTLCGGLPEAVTEFGSGQPKMDAATGKPLFSVQVVWITAGDTDVVKVRTVRPPQGLTLGEPVVIINLTAVPWSMNDRAGIAFRCDRIETANRAGTVPTRPVGDQ